MINCLWAVDDFTAGNGATNDPIELPQGKNIGNAGFEGFLPAELQPLLDQHKAHLKEAAWRNRGRPLRRGRVSTKPIQAGWAMRRPRRRVDNGSHIS
jgi:hypothetical protein